MPEPEPMRCCGCHESHTEWSDAGTGTVSGRYHRGVEYRYECDRCGNVTVLLGL